MQIQIFLLTFPACVPNTGDNDVMYLTRIKRTSKTEKERQCLELIVLVNRCKIYVYINNKAVILLLMAIYNKNQATVPLVKIIPKTASGCQLSTEKDDMFKLNLSLLKWWRHLYYRQNNSQNQFEHRLFNAKPLKIFFKNPLQNSTPIFLGYV